MKKPPLQALLRLLLQPGRKPSRLALYAHQKAADLQWENPCLLPEPYSPSPEPPFLHPPR